MAEFAPLNGHQEQANYRSAVAARPVELVVIAFFDASALIYQIEGAEPFAGRVRAALSSLRRQQRTLSIALSRLSWLECRVRPAREKDTATLQAYDEFFTHHDLHWVELGRDVVELATAIRIHHGLRTPDAL